jgi:iron(III) transport system ATP-binding protein
MLSAGSSSASRLRAAFIIEPGVLLMDEPLSNLDAKAARADALRDQKAPAAAGDHNDLRDPRSGGGARHFRRIAVMKAGLIMHVGAPEEVYRHPHNKFVSGFIGTTNFY